MEAALLGDAIEIRRRLHLRLERLGDLFGLLLRLLPLELIFDLGADLVERPRRRLRLSTTLMMWKPNEVFTRSLISPGFIANAACSNSGTIVPRPK